MNVADLLRMNKWLVASATKFAHPDKQVRVELDTPERKAIILLSLPEAEAAIRSLMQAYADAIGKGATFCAHPSTAGELREPLPPCCEGEGTGHRQAVAQHLDVRQAVTAAAAVCR